MRFFAYSAWALTAIVAPAQILEFADVTTERGLTYTGNCGPGCFVAVGDFDNDGWEDLALVGRGTDSLTLYRNVAGRFEDVTPTALPEGAPRTGAAIFCDLDGDGDQDLALARWHAGQTSTSFDALENRGGQFFRTTVGPLGLRPGKLSGMTVGDIDRDGLPEVVILRPSNGTLIRNLGNWTFTDHTAAAGLDFERTDLLGNWSGVLACFAGQPRLDLHVAIDYGVDVHAHNQGDGTFVDASVQVGTQHVGNDMGVAVADIDHDGDLDIFSTNIFAHTLYINDGTGVFTDEATPRGASVPVMDMSRWGYGCTFADLDLDGDEDLVTLAVPGHGSVLSNDGTGHFAPVDTSGLDLHGYGLVVFDYDRDGDLDLLTTHASVPPRLFERVGTPTRNWLAIRLRGRTSPADGLGARVVARVGTTPVMREIFTGDSFYSGRSQYVHLGLGDQPAATDVRVYWPSGIMQPIGRLAANQQRTLLEPHLRDGRPIADLDADCDVDIDDLLLVLTHFGVAEGSPGDVDRDADTDLSDLASVLAQFGTACY